MKTLDLTQAARFLQMSEDALMRKARAGIVPGTKVGRRWVFSEDQLLEMIRRLVGERQAQFKSVYAVSNANGSWRRAALLLRTPQWACVAAISEVYLRCERLSHETGIKHHVDHVMPLLGRTVSGLHVAENLRVIPAADNLRKSNHWHDPDAKPIRIPTEAERMRILRKYANRLSRA